jgi:hypothetical protein
MSYKTDLQSNNVDLQNILNTINSLPDAGSGGGGDIADLQYCWLSNHYCNHSVSDKVPPNAIIFFKPGWTWEDFMSSEFNRCMPDMGDGTGVGSPDAQPVTMLKLDYHGYIVCAIDELDYAWVWADYMNTEIETPTAAITPGRVYYMA